MSRVVTCGQCGASFDLEKTQHTIYMLNNHHSVAWLRNTVYLCYTCYGPIAEVLQTLGVTVTQVN